MIAGELCDMLLFSLANFIMRIIIVAVSCVIIIVTIVIIIISVVTAAAAAAAAAAATMPAVCYKRSNDGVGRM